MDILFNSRFKQYKNPMGCVLVGEKVEITVKVKRELLAIKVFINVFTDNTAAFKKQLCWCEFIDGYDIFECEFCFNEIGLYFYNFIVITNTQRFIARCDENGNATFDGSTKDWQITSYQKGINDIQKYKGAVIYQIFPDSFNKCGEMNLEDKLMPFSCHQSLDEPPQFLPCDGVYNNKFFGGNIKGIEQKIEYIKSFGVSVIYLNPIFMALSNHRYDTADYLRIDPMLGSEQDFISLCDVAHQSGISVILDGVFSHTGENSLYFDKYNTFNKNGAYNNPLSPYKSWYQWNEYPHDYASWWGITSLPCTNELDNSFLDFIVRSENSVIKKWLKLGADGFRLDVADELPDEFIKILKQEIYSVKKDAILIGEVWEDASNKISYGTRRRYLLGDELDSVMNYVYKDAIINFINQRIDARAFNNTIMTIVENYPKETLHCLMNSLSTHDTPRILTMFSDDSNFSLSKQEMSQFVHNPNSLQKAVIKLKCAMFLQFMLAGSPCIYYGDEIGMTGYSDPFNRAYFKWWNINTEIVEFIKNLSTIKNNYDSIKIGEFNSFLYDDMVYGFIRRFGQQTVVCYVNMSDKEYLIDDSKYECLICSGGKGSIDKYGFAAYLVL